MTFPAARRDDPTGVQAPDGPTSVRESTLTWLWRVAGRVAWDARCAVARWRRGCVLCPDCNGGGLVAPGDWCPGCGGSGEIGREDAHHG